MSIRSDLLQHRPGLSALWQEPLALLALLCVYQLTVWSFAPLGLARGLHVNILQVALWGREWLMVSYKHPNLPGLAFESAEEVFGYSALLAYGLAQLFVTATLLIVYLTARDLLRDRWQAVAATALLPCLFYFSVPSILFNHNIAQMPFWVAFIWLFNRALDGKGLVIWVAAAIVMALAMYVKLSSGLLLGIAGLWLLIDPRGRTALRGPGPWLAAALFLLGIVPLLNALRASGFQPLHYASDRAAGAPQPLLLISVSAVVLASPIAVMWLARAVSLRDIPALVWRKDSPSGQRFLLWFVLAPIVMCMLAAFRSDIRVLWLTPMFSLWGVYLIGNVSRPLAAEQAWRLASIAIAANLAMLIAYGAYFNVANRHAARPLRWEDWPQQDMTAALEARWTAETHGAPLRIVGGPLHFSGAVAFWADNEPSLFENLDPSLSPWITPQRIAQQGMLLVWEPGDFPDQVIGKWTSRYKEETVSLTWSTSPVAKPVTLHYLIVPPPPGTPSDADE